MNMAVLDQETYPLAMAFQRPRNNIDVTLSLVDKQGVSA